MELQDAEIKKAKPVGKKPKGKPPATLQEEVIKLKQYQVNRILGLLFIPFEKTRVNNKYTSAKDRYDNKVWKEFYPQI